MVCNRDVRAAAVLAGIKLYQIAGRLGKTDCEFSRMLRKELPSEKKAEIYRIISELQAEENKQMGVS